VDYKIKTKELDKTKNENEELKDYMENQKTLGGGNSADTKKLNEEI
jgi:hypothetical protein